MSMEMYESSVENVRLSEKRRPPPNAAMSGRSKTYSRPSAHKAVRPVPPEETPLVEESISKTFHRKAAMRSETEKGRHQCNGYKAQYQHLALRRKIAELHQMAEEQACGACQERGARRGRQKNEGAPGSASQADVSP